jgi:large subunit ribosomal protein L36
MKYKSSIKKRSSSDKLVKRKGKAVIINKLIPRNKQSQ